ncbi:MAG: hypothetical protein IGS48_13375 [Oscillatoriales cyanobacterium C42_A2020_001]|nr:hypothetical protein [Leptolyngbyaceae cyanobacterium C42_A2020_001]
MAVRPDSTMGYRTGAKLLLLFLFALVFMGYSLFLSVCLSAIAALTGGFISSWWHAKEDFVTDEETESMVVDADSASPTTVQPTPIRYGFGVKSAREGRAIRPLRGVGWLFRRNR